MQPRLAIALKRGGKGGGEEQGKREEGWKEGWKKGWMEGWMEERKEEEKSPTAMTQTTVVVTNKHPELELNKYCLSYNILVHHCFQKTKTVTQRQHIHIYPDTLNLQPSLLTKFKLSSLEELQKN